MIKFTLKDHSYGIIKKRSTMPQSEFQKENKNYNTKRPEELRASNFLQIDKQNTNSQSRSSNRIKRCFSLRSLIKVILNQGHTGDTGINNHWNMVQEWSCGRRILNACEKTPGSNLQIQFLQNTELFLECVFIFSAVIIHMPLWKTYFYHLQLVTVQFTQGTLRTPQSTNCLMF